MLVTKWPKPSPTSNSCHQHSSSPRFVSNIDVIRFWFFKLRISSMFVYKFHQFWNTFIRIPICQSRGQWCYKKKTRRGRWRIKTSIQIYSNGKFLSTSNLFILSVMMIVKHTYENDQETFWRFIITIFSI